MDNYSSMEECINEAQKNVANLDTDQIRRQGEIEATDAARREATERGVDLTKVEGTGSDGRIIVSDVVEAAEAMEDGAGEDGAASEAVQGAQDAAGQAAGQVQQATDQAGQVAGQAQDAAQERPSKPRTQPVRPSRGAGHRRRPHRWPAAGRWSSGRGHRSGRAGRAGRARHCGTGRRSGSVRRRDRPGPGTARLQDRPQEAAGGSPAARTRRTGGQRAAGGGEEPKATNAARRRAEELGVDLSTIQGTGSGGLITIKDVTGS